MGRPFHRACALAASAFLYLGCNTIAGINDPVDPPGSTSGTSGGTSGTSGGTDNLARFEGTWGSADRATTVCGELLPADPISYGIRRSGTGIVITLVQFPSCKLAFTVSGDVATATRDQVCTFLISTGKYAYAYSSASTFTLTSATTAEVAIFAEITQLAGGGGGTCAYEEQSLFQKE